MRLIPAIRSALTERRARTRLRAAALEAALLCERCDHRQASAGLPPLDLAPCPRCGWKTFVPHRVGDYLLHEPVGAGGFSRVYKALRCGEWKTPYAVKLLREDADDGQAALFRFEAGVHRRVSGHPHIVPLLEAGDTYHVMPYVAGRNLRQIVEAVGRQPETQVLAWARQIIPALQHIAAHGYLYRDVSPGNFLAGPGGRIALIDFGLVLAAEDADRAEHDRHVEGTAEYVPPERVLRLGEDERSVVYSLGHLLFFLLAGEPMMTASTRENAALRHVSAVRVAFSGARLPGCSPALVDLIGRMTRPDPAERPAGLAALDLPA